MAFTEYSPETFRPQIQNIDHFLEAIYNLYIAQHLSGTVLFIQCFQQKYDDELSFFVSLISNIEAETGMFGHPSYPNSSYILWREIYDLIDFRQGLTTEQMKKLLVTNPYLSLCSKGSEYGKRYYINGKMK